MATLSVQSVKKSHGAATILKGISLDIADGEFLVLVGPSGCGKSTLLRCIAGLEELDSGAIVIDGANVTQSEPRDRDLAMVFQSYALYPHLTVRENLAFGLKMRKTPPSEIVTRVAEAARMLEIEPLLDRLPKNLSGGQRQRVAMGRAVVRRPKAFLFDEPLSNLDASLRGQMRIELMRLHRQLSATMIYVTHDQVEAMTLATRIAVMKAGELQQVGTPDELYQHPANQFVAKFIGTPEMNLIPADDARKLALVHSLPDGTAQVGVRAEDVHVGHGVGAADAMVEVVEHLGWEALVHLRIGALALVARMKDPPAVGARTSITLDAAGLHFFDGTGARIFSSNDRASAQRARP